MLHSGNVAGGGGQTESFQNEGGGEGVYNVFSLQKSRGGGKNSPRGGGGKNSPRGGKTPCPRKRSPGYVRITRSLCSHRK